MKKKTNASAVLAVPPTPRRAAIAHLSRKLSLETDPSDVRADQLAGIDGFVLVDARAPEAYARGHVPGAIPLWHKLMDASTASILPKNKLIVTYCASAACNASTKGALKLARLGFRVKEMIGGIEAWKAEGYPVARG